MEIQQYAPRKTPNILVTGTPGTGKTTFTQLLNESLNFTVINIGKLITQHKLFSGWNEQYNVSELDEEKVQTFLEQNYKIADGGLLFDFHSPDIFPKDYFDLVILMRCENGEMYRRLQQRGYKEQKIKVNIQCEIFDEIKLDLEEIYEERVYSLLELRNQKKEDMQPNLEKAIAWLLEYRQKWASKQK